MEGSNESTELWRHPNSLSLLALNLLLITKSNFSSQTTWRWLVATKLPSVQRNDKLPWIKNLFKNLTQALEKNEGSAVS